MQRVHPEGDVEEGVKRDLCFCETSVSPQTVVNGVKNTRPGQNGLLVC